MSAWEYTFHVVYVGAATSLDSPNLCLRIAYWKRSWFLPKKKQ